MSTTAAYLGTKYSVAVVSHFNFFCAVAFYAVPTAVREFHFGQVTRAISEYGNPVIVYCSAMTFATGSCLVSPLTTQSMSLQIPLLSSEGERE